MEFSWQADGGPILPANWDISYFRKHFSVSTNSRPLSARQRNATSSNIGPLSARQRNAIQMAFCWRTNSGPRFSAGLVEILVLIAYSQKAPVIVNAAVSSWVRNLKFELSLHLHPYFMYVSCKCCCESAGTAIHVSTVKRPLKNRHNKGLKTDVNLNVIFVV